MFAVIKTGGKQYKVTKGDILKVEKLPSSKNGTVVFDKVLMVSDKDSATMGNPYLSKASVEAKVVKEFKDRKVDVYKYKNKTRYRRKYGHRQQLTEVKIEAIKA